MRTTRTVVSSLISELLGLLKDDTCISYPVLLFDLHSVLLGEQICAQASGYISARLLITKRSKIFPLSISLKSKNFSN